MALGINYKFQISIKSKTIPKNDPNWELTNKPNVNGIRILIVQRAKLTSKKQRAQFQGFVSISRSWWPFANSLCVFQKASQSRQPH
jgi:hypothetical protein